MRRERVANAHSASERCGEVEIEGENDSALISRHAKDIDIRQSSQAKFIEVNSVMAGGAQLSNDRCTDAHVSEELHARL